MATPPPEGMLLHPMPSYMSTTTIIKVPASPKAPLQQIVACKHCQNKFRASTHENVYCSKECKVMQNFESQWYKTKAPIDEAPPSTNAKMPAFWYNKNNNPLPTTNTVPKIVSTPSMEQKISSSTMVSTNNELSSTGPLSIHKNVSAPCSDHQSMEQMISTTMVVVSVPIKHEELCCHEKAKEVTSIIISESMMDVSIKKESIQSPLLLTRTDFPLFNSEGENSDKSGSVHTDVEAAWKNVDSIKYENVVCTVDIDSTTVTVTETLSITEAEMICTSKSPIDQSSSTPIVETDRCTTINLIEGITEMVQPPVGPKPSRCNERPNNLSRRNIQVL